MKKSTRALVGMVVLDLLLGMGALFMVVKTRTGEWQASDPAAAISAITTTAGAAIGIVSVILGLAWWRHRRSGN